MLHPVEAQTAHIIFVIGTLVFNKEASVCAVRAVCGVCGAYCSMEPGRCLRPSPSTCRRWCNSSEERLGGSKARSLSVM
jgi:hypothetical protein